MSKMEEVSQICFVFVISTFSFFEELSQTCFVFITELNCHF